MAQIMRDHDYMTAARPALPAFRLTAALLAGPKAIWHHVREELQLGAMALDATIDANARDYYGFPVLGALAAGAMIAAAGWGYVSGQEIKRDVTPSYQVSPPSVPGLN